MTFFVDDSYFPSTFLGVTHNKKKLPFFLNVWLCLASIFFSLCYFSQLVKATFSSFAAKNLHGNHFGSVFPQTIPAN